MAELVTVSGRPMVHDLRATLDAVGYVARYGVEWRALPVDFPPYAAVYAFFVRWSARGLPERLAGRLRGRIRIAAGRGELPTAGSIDSQSVKASEAVAAGACGYDAGKKTKGQKRHIAVDTLGLLLCVIVTAASVQDRDGAHCLLARLREKFSTVTLVWADGGYSGRLVEWAKSALALTVSIVKRSDAARGFVVLPRLLWNLNFVNCMLAHWGRMGVIGSNVAVAGIPIWRGVAPVGVGMSARRSRSRSSAAWPSSTAACSSSVSGTLASIRCRLSFASSSCALLESFGA